MAADVDPIRVYLTFPQQSIVRSTDRSYLYDRLIRLSERYPLRFVPNRSLVSRLYEDSRYGFARLRSLLGPPAKENIWARVGFPDEIDVAYAYGQFPTRPPVALPIVWQQTFAWSPAAIDPEIRRESLRQSRTAAMRRADAVVVPSESSLENLVGIFPWAEEKAEVVPYYLPDVEPLSVDVVAEKHKGSVPLEVLFVGKQARRKGLATLARAWPRLSAETKRLITVTVVTPFLDGKVPLPKGWVHLPWAKSVTDLMTQAHVLVFPTSYEAYGLVLVEAMAYGMAIVTSDAPVQRDIVQDGGFFVHPDDDVAVAEALTRLAHERAEGAAMGRANVSRFRSKFWHEIVGPAHLHVFTRAAHIKRVNPDRAR